MNLSTVRIYLASRSPRRRELLKQIGVPFDVLLFREAPPRRADLDETPHAGEPPEAYVRRVCGEKARLAWRVVEQRRLRRQPVLAADTAVCVGDEILGKPAGREDAGRMLALLSGREHRVLSAVGVALGDRFEMELSDTRVRLRELSAADIRDYVASGETADKAGAYAIQGRAAAFVSALNGSYSGVMGLPLYETARLLAAFA
ncbi:MAG: septum formation inhibitor Maf [Burkholderiales bacterium]|nr:septum formation inhibitor Maf [Burkholderiales bacterium]